MISLYRFKGVEVWRAPNFYFPARGTSGPKKERKTPGAKKPAWRLVVLRKLKKRALDWELT
jgi:hypothetical protein